MSRETVGQGYVIGGKGPETRRWAVWESALPSRPSSLTVAGEVRVPNAGVHPILCPRGRPDPASSDLCLDLFLVQKPGSWAPGADWRAARYVLTSPGGPPLVDHVTVLSGGKTVADLGVQAVV